MYFEKINPILEDLENKEIDVAGGSAVGMSLATVNSLIKYICNLTFGKKKYEEVQEEVKKIYEEADILKQKSLHVIDEDKEILENILDAYKTRNENPKKYDDVCKSAVEFCIDVLNLAYDTFELSDRISKVGNKMLASDFKICKNYSFASIQSAIVNVEINLECIEDERFILNAKQKCDEILEKARSYVQWKF